MKPLIPILLLGIFMPGPTPANDSLYLVNKRLDSLAVIIKIQSEVLEKENLRLEKSYSVGLNSINYYLTIGLGLITVITAIVGIIGIKSITEIRKNYNNELKKLEKYRKQLLLKIDSIITQKEKLVEDKIEEIQRLIHELRSETEKVKKQNEEQEKDIKLLWYRMKIRVENNKQDYRNALKIIDEALKIYPDEDDLLASKILCHGKLLEYQKAIDAIKLVPHDSRNFLFLYENLGELYLLTKQLHDFKLLFEKYEQQFNQNRPSYCAYLKVYYLYSIREYKGLSGFISSFVESGRIGSGEYLTKEQLKEFYFEVPKEPDSKEKELLMAFIDFLQGEKNASQVADIIKLQGK